MFLEDKMFIICILVTNKNIFHIIIKIKCVYEFDVLPINHKRFLTCYGHYKQINKNSFN